MLLAMCLFLLGLLGYLGGFYMINRLTRTGSNNAWHLLGAYGAGTAGAIMLIYSISLLQSSL
jgi:hypothetical protein